MGDRAESLGRTLADSGVRAGDEVIVPSFGMVDVAEAVRRAGATPVFADIEAASYCLDPDAVADAVTSRTVAIVPAHQFGHRADMARIGETARRHGLLIVEHEGSDSPAADTMVRQANAAYLTARLTGVVTPRVAPGAGHTYQQYVVRVPGNGRPDRDAFALVLRSKGISCRVPVQTPVHRMPQFLGSARLPGAVRLPETERASDECLALPVEAGLGRRDLHRVAAACNALGGLLQPAL